MSQEQTTTMTRRQAMAASLGMAGIAGGGALPAFGAAAGSGALKGKKVIVAIGEFSEALETYYMVYRLMEEGVEPVVTGTKKKKVQLVVHDFEEQYTNYTEKLGYLIQADATYADINPAEFAGLVIPGGRGPEEIRQHTPALKITKYFLEEGMPLGAMCHGPMVLYAAGSVKGRRIAAFHGIRADVELAGATFVDEPVVVDGKLVTSRGWPDLPMFMPKFVDALR